MSLLHQVHMFTSDFCTSLHLKTRSALLLDKLGGMIGNNHNWSVSESKLSQKLGCTERTVRTAIAQLVGLGIIIISKDKLDKRRNRYSGAPFLINYHNDRSIYAQNPSEFTKNISPSLLLHLEENGFTIEAFQNLLVKSIGKKQNNDQKKYSSNSSNYAQKVAISCESPDQILSYVPFIPKNNTGRNLPILNTDIGRNLPLSENNTGRNLPISSCGKVVETEAYQHVATTPKFAKGPIKPLFKDQYNKRTPLNPPASRPERVTEILDSISVEGGEWDEFVSMRKSLLGADKAWATSDHMQIRLAERLKTTAEAHQQSPQEILAQSLDNMWKSFFPISGGKQFKAFNATSVKKSENLGRMHKAAMEIAKDHFRNVSSGNVQSSGYVPSDAPKIGICDQNWTGRIADPVFLQNKYLLRDNV